MQKATIINHDLGRELAQDKQEQDGSLHNWIANSRQPNTEHHCQGAHESHVTSDAKTHFATSSRASSEQDVAETTSQALQETSAQRKENKDQTIASCGPVAEASATVTTHAATSSSANSANMTRCLRHHYQHAKDEVIALTARTRELSLMLLTSRQEHAQYNAGLQLRTNHATATNATDVARS